jgi:hypothetical protein
VCVHRLRLPRPGYGELVGSLDRSGFITPQLQHKETIWESSRASWTAMRDQLHSSGTGAAPGSVIMPLRSIVAQATDAGRGICRQRHWPAPLHYAARAGKLQSDSCC